MKLEELKKWEKNPRKITPSKARILAKTLLRFGDLSAIVYNVRLQRLATAHQRKDVIDQGEIIIQERLDNPDKRGTVARGYVLYDDEKFNYREVDWDEETHAAAAIAANESAGYWDMQMLKAQLVELDTGAFDIELTGLEIPNVENIVNSVKVPKVVSDEIEWDSEPESDNVSDKEFHSILVKFKTEDDLLEFAELVEQSLTLESKTLWFKK